MTSQYLVFGKNGQLGRCLTRALGGAREGVLVDAFGRDDRDIANRDAVMGLDPDASWLLNAAAFTAVDLCESETAACHAANCEGPGRLAGWCSENAVKFVHVSTDYVFAGDGQSPYRETDATLPRTEYGRSKLAGETAVRERLPSAWIVRTSWLFGPGKNFVGAIVRQGVLREAGKVEGPLRVVDDQVGCPTYAADLAQAILALTTHAQAEEGGLLHLCNAEACSWWDFARAILDGTGYADLEIHRVSTSDFPTPAPRPAYSVLDASKAAGLGIKMRNWRDALTDYLASDDFRDLHRALRVEVARAS